MAKLRYRSYLFGCVLYSCSLDRVIMVLKYQRNNQKPLWRMAILFHVARIRLIRPHHGVSLVMMREVTCIQRCIRKSSDARVGGTTSHDGGGVCRLGYGNCSECSVAFVWINNAIDGLPACRCGGKATCTMTLSIGRSNQVICHHDSCYLLGWCFIGGLSRCITKL